MYVSILYTDFGSACLDFKIYFPFQLSAIVF